MERQSEHGTAMDAKALFLTRIKCDSGLQRLLQDPAISSAAVSISRAAGFVVTPAELAASHNPGRPSWPEGSAEDASSSAWAAEGDLIDFDGDGIAYAVRRGERWQLTSQDEG